MQQHSSNPAPSKSSWKRKLLNQTWPNPSWNHKSQRSHRVSVILNWENNGVCVCVLGAKMYPPLSLSRQTCQERSCTNLYIKVCLRVVPCLIHILLWQVKVYVALAVTVCCFAHTGHDGVWKILTLVVLWERGSSGMSTSPGSDRLSSSWPWRCSSKSSWRRLGWSTSWGEKWRSSLTSGNICRIIFYC